MRQGFDDIFKRAQDAHAEGKIGEAAALYEEALKLRPEDAPCTYFLGVARFQLGQTRRAIELVRRAIAIDGSVAEHHCDLAAMLFAVDDDRAAIGAADQAISLRPDFPEALFIRGNALCKSERFEEGIDAYQRLIALRPEARDALNNLGMALLQLGRVEEAVGCFERIVRANPADAAADSNRVYAMLFSPDYGPDEIRGQLLNWNCRHRRSGPARPHENLRMVDRPLRIGYVSADFRDHVVGWSMLWMAHHDAAKFNVTCYSGVGRADATTQKLRGCARQWRDISRMPDAEAAELIRADRIDILVDLSLHTSGNRLPLFAMKPAPIQVTYLGYPGSTGVEAIDYRFSDRRIDSVNEQGEHTERTIYLPGCYWCYHPGGPAPDVSQPPCMASGRITFGCLNQFPKVSRAALETWKRVLAEVPSSRLLLCAPEGRHRERVIELLNVGDDRLEFLPRQSWADYIATYQRIDICLDPFPCGGGISTCDALWMGVPVITLRGKTSVGRGGASILHYVGLDELVSASTEQYVSAAIDLARDRPRLCGIRCGLRPRMRSSGVMNAVEFARGVEAAYLKMWGDWLDSLPNT
ncbi:MAG TPA: tetratricopeptide repeat protein [Tepidisphaeraceae bacterium]|nr:tetratricopeptide repeat protein [Tepidisphaeraceae bacterium]